MGNDFTAEQVDNSNNVGEIISVVTEEIGCLKVHYSGVPSHTHSSATCVSSLQFVPCFCGVFSLLSLCCGLWAGHAGKEDSRIELYIVPHFRVFT